MQFNIDQFYNYYANVSNLQFDSSKPKYTYFDNNIRKLIKKRKSGYYILINNKKVYVESLNPSIRQITFTVENPQNLDNHFHFGIRHGINNNKYNLVNADVVYFHKTDQISSSSKKSTNCYFKLDVDVTDIENINCVESQTAKMTTRFPIGSEDFKILKRIIQIPFGIKAGKSRQKTRRIKRKIRRTLRKN